MDFRLRTRLPLGLPDYIFYYNVEGMRILWGRSGVGENRQTNGEKNSGKKLLECNLCLMCNLLIRKVIHDYLSNNSSLDSKFS